MSNLKIVTKDYRIIKSAVVSFEPGLTLISATNSSGKSTLVKALRTVLDGDFGAEGNPRHGTTGYSVGLKCDDVKLTVRRVGKDTFIRFNEETERSKLGKGALNKLVPGFPLKRFDTLDSSFYPNIVSQGKLPIFEDISVFELFSAMFGDISKLSSRQDSLKKELLKSKKEVADNEALLNHYKTEELTTENALSQFSQAHPNLALEFENKNKALAISNEIAKIQSDMFLKFPNGIDSSVEEKVRLLETSQEALVAYRAVTEIQGYVDTLKDLRSKLQSLPTLPNPDLEVVELGMNLKVAQSNLDNIEQLIKELDKQIAEIETQLSVVKCPNLKEGVCPYQRQITELLQKN